MCEPSRIVMFALCALLTVGSGARGVLHGAIASGITVSLGSFRLSWPVDTRMFYQRAEAVGEGFCRAVATLGLVPYETCEAGVGALIGPQPAPGLNKPVQSARPVRQALAGCERHRARGAQSAARQDSSDPLPWYLAL